MKINYKAIAVAMLFPISVAAQSRNDAGLRGDAGATSGFFEASAPINFPNGATGWWHLLDVRHSNPNNYAMQFSGNFYDQDLFFRKTNDNPSTAWSKVLLETNGKVGIGTNSPVKKLEVNGDIFNRGILYQDTNSGLGSAAHGISWYSTGYTTWFDYMAPAGSTNAPSGTAAPADAASGVTTWALRSNIENSPSYGWIFESGQNGLGNAPTVKFAINASNGTFHSVGDGIVDGNLGVGTTDTKGYKLAVNGKVRAQEIKVETANWPDYVFAKDYELSTLQETEKHIKDKGHLPGIPSADEVKANGVDLGEMNAKLLQKIEELTLHLIEKDRHIENMESRLKKVETLLIK
ncbi:hypothetical protein [Pedobacter africanus]|uniref:Uncharacterized protein n=1 Tax=Pedobacter africanus TaxID=151894 RepID=A0A1W2BQP1_9SPHI|nr:hypothetical protein [Pedobacter africanus]SMC75277.1 hypothetical protein SAMN04488524_2565 [Pedobacter africanus]